MKRTPVYRIEQFYVCPKCGGATWLQLQKNGGPLHVCTSEKCDYKGSQHVRTKKRLIGYK